MRQLPLINLMNRMAELGKSDGMTLKLFCKTNDQDKCDNILTLSKHEVQV